MFCSQAMNHRYIDVRRRSVDLELAINCPRSSGPAFGFACDKWLLSTLEIGLPLTSYPGLKCPE